MAYLYYIYAIASGVALAIATGALQKVGGNIGSIIWNKITYVFWFLNRNDALVIFRDNFKDGNKNKWNLNTWGSKNPDKTNRIENGAMIFEINENELKQPEKGLVAYLDLDRDRGIYEGNSYEVSCKVAAIEDTSMVFRLWLNDHGQFPSVGTHFFTPKTKFKTVRKIFIPTKTNTIRIHLHAKAGAGRIIIKEVTVRKIA